MHLRISNRSETRLDKQKSQTGDGLAFVLETRMFVRGRNDIKLLDVLDEEARSGAVDVALDCDLHPQDLANLAGEVVMNFCDVVENNTSTNLVCHVDVHPECFHDAFSFSVFNVLAITRLCLPETSIADAGEADALRDADDLRLFQNRFRARTHRVSKRNQPIRFCYTGFTGSDNRVKAKPEKENEP